MEFILSRTEYTYLICYLFRLILFFCFAFPFDVLTGKKFFLCFTDFLCNSFNWTNLLKESSNIAFFVHVQLLVFAISYTEINKWVKIRLKSQFFRSLFLNVSGEVHFNSKNNSMIDEYFCDIMYLIKGNRAYMFEIYFIDTPSK